MILIRNPFFIYTSVFLVTLTVYLFSWSDLYPELSLELVFFVFFTAFVSSLIGFFTRKFFILPDYFPKIRLGKIIYLFIVVGYFLEFAHARAIPLLVFFNPDREVFGAYLDFGIPVFHVFLVAMSHYVIACAAYNKFMARTSGAGNSVIIFSVLVLDLLSGSRGLFIFGLIIVIFVKIYSVERVKIKSLLMFVSLFMVFSYLFGVVGQFRSAHNDENYSNKIFGANERFESTGLPAPYLWVYIYVTSPLANLQKTINENQDIEYSLSEFIVFDILNESISKRISPDGGSAIHDNRIAPYLTVGSLYFRPFNRLGWYGMFFIFFYLILYVYSHVVLFYFSGKHFVPGLSVLNALVFLSIFSNMITTGFAVTLFFPVIIGLCLCVHRFMGRGGLLK